MTVSFIQLELVYCHMMVVLHHNYTSLQPDRLFVTNLKDLPGNYIPIKATEIKGCRRLTWAEEMPELQCRCHGPSSACTRRKYDVVLTDAYQEKIRN